jgi:hypothetical protein
MTTEFDLASPYCGDAGVIYLEPEVRGTLVQDCEVCCSPWLVTVTWDEGERYVQVARADGSD